MENRPGIASNPATDAAPATAVLVFHGMGQQVPFETLGTVAEIMRKRHEITDQGLTCHAAAENVTCLGGAKADAIIPRIRLSLQKDGVTQRHIDFYESYWAPITAGKVNSVDALKFLVLSGWTAILRSLRAGFVRYFWRGKHTFPVSRAGNIAALGGVLLIVVSLAFLSARSLSVLHDKDWRARVEELSLHFRAIHLLVSPTLATYLAYNWSKSSLPIRTGLGFGFLMGFAQGPWILMPNRSLGPAWVSECLTVKMPMAAGALKILFCLTLASILIVTVRLWLSKEPVTRAKANSQLIWFQSGFIGLTLVAAAAGSAYLMYNPHAYAKGDLAGFGLQLFYGMMGLGVLSGMRYFLLEYVGDLAAYLSSHEASKFFEIRSAILADAFKSACHIYASDYEKVNLVGHSLGSVIAYDTLNGVICHDALKNQANGLVPWNTVEKTRMLLTFGSPLDKTAFIFRSQVENNPTRESLAAAKQPLLEESHRYRPDFWVNVWSPSDVISGRLDFYDVGKVESGKRAVGEKPYEFAYTRFAPDPNGIGCSHLPFRTPPADKVSPVLSLVDPEADIPLAAHTQFWGNDLIYDILAKSILGGSPTSLEEFMSVKLAAP